MTIPLRKGKIVKGSTHVTQGTTMKDDEKYQKLMSAYKVMRRDPRKQREAQKLLQAAFALEKKGQVSPDVVLGMAYV